MTIILNKNLEIE